MYDAIIVGARCAGAPTAMLMARKGYRVLLVDKASFPSDTISTHIIWPHGAEIMDRWGLLDRLAATGCPPVALNMVFDIGPFALMGGVIDTNKGRGGFCPRRTVLAAARGCCHRGGAELREDFTVEDLVRTGDRVVGSRTPLEWWQHRGAGPNRHWRRWRHSFVARAVAAPSTTRSPARDLLLQLLQRIRGQTSSSTSATTRGRPVSQPDGLTSWRRSAERQRRYARHRKKCEKVHESIPRIATCKAPNVRRWVGTAASPTSSASPMALVGPSSATRV
jgi:hypothetical protein